MAKNSVKNANPMSQDELLGLQNDVAEVGLQDAALGRVLDAMLSHLARLNNLDYPVVVEAPAEEVQTSAPAAPAEEGTNNAN